MIHGALRLWPGDRFAKPRQSPGKHPAGVSRMARVLGFALVMGYGAAFAGTGTGGAKRPPNVILIMADDVGWECFGSYGAQDYKTPNLDRLASGGLQFKHCYSTPLCTPSRVEIMTGKYSFRNYTHFGYLNPEEKTFGHLMKAAGYRTAIAGKWQLNGLYHGADGHSDGTRPNKAGFDEYCLWQLTTGVAGEKGGERFWSPPLEHNGTFLTKMDNHGKYGPDLMSDFVCDFIGRNKDAPFFIYYPTVLVHNPFVPTPDTIGPASRGHKSNTPPKTGREKKENFVAMVNYLDKIVGKIVRKVDEVGQLENTIILFTADNGTNTGITSNWDGMNIRGGKGGTTDMGTHVPLIAYWKGHTPEGGVLDDLVDFTDFYPTLASAAGVTLKETELIDGKSFLPQLLGEKGRPRDWVLCHYQPYWGTFKGSQFVRDERFKLYRDGRLFNVPDDLEEKRPLEPGQAGEQADVSRRELTKALEAAPPAPPVEGGRHAKERPVHPTWPRSANPGD